MFGSPRHLNLRLLCINRRLTKALDIWPEFPIIIHVDEKEVRSLPSVTDVISVLERNDRVCRIFIDDVPNSSLEAIVATSKPFPALIELELASFKKDTPTLRGSFLGGSVPSLRSLKFWGVPFPALGKLLLSTRELVALSLGYIPSAGFISP